MSTVRETQLTTGMAKSISLMMVPSRRGVKALATQNHHRLAKSNIQLTLF